MAQSKPPVPLPRTFPPDKTSLEDKKPQSPTHSPQSGAARSPPPVPPKKVSARRSLESPDGSLEIVKISDREKEKQLVLCPRLAPPAVCNPYCMSPASANEGLMITETMQRVTIYQTTNDATNEPIYENEIKEEKVVVQQVIHNYKIQPPQLPSKPTVKSKPGNPHQDEILDADYLKDWWEKVRSWSLLSQDLKLKDMEETKIISVKARRIYNAIQLYDLLLAEHGGTLKDHIIQLVCIADNLDKVSKSTKIAGITGGATGVAGGVAAAGLVLAPFTFGASLALTAVGVGVAAAGGVTAASAAIANKVNVSQEKKKIENIFQEHEALMVEIQACLKFINEGIEHLRKHDLSTPSAAGPESVRVARVAQLATANGPTARAIEASSKASGVIQGLSLSVFFTQKNGSKLKRGFESKLGEEIRQVVKEMDEGLKELMQIKGLFSQFISPGK